MSNQRNATKAGLFIVVSVLLAVGVVIAIEGGGRFAEAGQTRAVRFKFSDDLGGLRVGDEVRLGGFKVGTVRSIEPTDLGGADPHLLVRFSIPARYPLHADASVGVQITLTGTACLNILDPGSPRLADTGAPLVGRPDPKTVALNGLATIGDDLSGIAHDVRTGTVPRLNNTLESFHQTGDSANQLVRHVEGQVDPAVAKYRVVADKTGAMMDSVHEMIGPSTKDFHGIMADFHEISGGIKGKLPGLLDQVRTSLDSARSALEGAQKTADNTKDISDSLRSVITGNKGKLDEMIASFKVTGDNLKAASVEIRHSPWRLLYKPSNSELSNLNVYDAAREFVDGATELNDAAQALRDAANDKSADAQKINQLLQRLENDFEKFDRVEKKLWSDVKQ